MRIPRIPPTVARKLGHYVYLYVNPIDGRVFYVGKGKGRRALAHLNVDGDKEVAKTIREIQAADKEPRIELLAHGLPSVKAALAIEAAAIDLLGLGNLANAVRGHGAERGRMPLTEAVALHARRPAKIREPSILIRINKLYRYGMSPSDLYDATRSAWKVGPRREYAELALAVFQGVIREVYRITQWLPAGSTFTAQRGGERVKWSGRWEFVGTLAEEAVRKRYVDRYVGKLFSQGAQNPIAYVRCDYLTAREGGSRA